MEATLLAADAASATTVKVARRISGSRNISRNISRGISPSTRYQPLDSSRILPWHIIRPCPTLRSAVAHGSERFVGGKYTYIISSSSGTSEECVALMSQYCWQYIQAIAARVLWVWYIHSGTYTYSSSCTAVVRS